MKRILIVCRSFFPEISPRSFRATELAKEFARQGHDVTILFPTNGGDYTEFEKIHNVKIKDLGTLRFKPIQLNGGGPVLLLRRALRRTLQVLFEYPDIQLMFMVAKALKNERGHDLLISIAVPHPIHWGVAKAWKKGNSIAKKWIADCGDPFMLARLDTFHKPFYFKYFEKSFCRKCDYITIPVETAKTPYYPEFHDKIRVIPQGFRLDEIDDMPAFVKKHEYPRFAYAGNFIPGRRDPKALLDHLSKMKDYFKFFIFSSHLSMINGYKTQLNDKLELREPLPRVELLKVLTTMDFLVNIDNNTNEQIPSKLIDYAIAGRPVMNIRKDTDLTVVDEFLSGDYAKRMMLEDLKKYDIRNVAAQFMEL
ncbi:MAG: glycosyltransferase family 4 protein [Bacteroidales bacterium]|nr:glycosyltransferase family 4 protein [Bacteroidales bacterium]